MPPRARQSGFAIVLACACGAGEPGVDVHTYVGDRFERSDPEAQRQTVWKVLETAIPELLGHVAASAPAADPRAPAPTPHPPRTARELDALVQAIERGPLDDVHGPARRIAEADGVLWPELRAALLAERKAPKVDYRSLLDAIGGDVPDRNGHFERAWKKAHGHDVRLSEDWFEDLLALPRGKISAALLPVYRDCLLETAVLRAASRIGRVREHTPAVVESLLEAAYLHHGTFRDEVGRAVVAIGDEAIPTLVRAMARRSSRADEELVNRKAAYAEHLLGRMDRLHPRRATEAVRDDPRLLAEVLSAYGDTGLGEAADVLLELADDRGPGVRAEARRAFEALVRGPLPEAVRRTVRLIGGGTAHARASLSPGQRANAALEARLVDGAAAVLEPPCEPRREDGSVDATCEQRPARLTAAYFDWLDARRQARDREIIDRALAEAGLLADGGPSDGDEAWRRLERGAALVDPLLAEDPELQDDTRLVQLFARLGQAYEQRGDRARAAAQYRKAAMLAGPREPAKALRVAALLNEARTEGLDPAGRRMLLETAALEAPGHTRVERALERLNGDRSHSPSDGARTLSHAIAMALLLALLAWMGKPLRRRLLVRTPHLHDAA